MALHISISAEPITHLGSFAVTNSMFTSLIVSALLILVALNTNRSLKTNRKPTGLQNIFEMIIDGFYNLTFTITQSRSKSNLIFPVIMTAFLWILCNNWFGLLPGVGTVGFYESPTGEQVFAPHTSTVPFAYAATPLPAARSIGQTDLELPEGVVPEKEIFETTKTGDTHTVEAKFVPFFRAATADLNTTLALAIISMTFVQFVGIKYLGLSYFKKFINFSGPIQVFVGFLETISEFVKIISFAFRLFGNIFAGEVLLAVMSFLIPILVPAPFYGLEIFVGIIQALVFALLSLVFMSMATIGHEGDH